MRGLEVLDLPHGTQLSQTPWKGTTSQGQAGILSQWPLYGNVNTRVGSGHVEYKQTMKPLRRHQATLSKSLKSGPSAEGTRGPRKEAEPAADRHHSRALALLYFSAQHLTPCSVLHKHTSRSLSTHPWECQLPEPEPVPTASLLQPQGPAQRLAQSRGATDTG